MRHRRLAIWVATIVLPIVVGFTLAVTVLEDKLLLVLGNPARITEPAWLPYRIDASQADAERSVGGLCLNAEVLRRGEVLVSVVNLGDGPARFNTLAFRRLARMHAWVVDTEDEWHDLDLTAAYPETRATPTAADTVALARGESYSHLVRVTHPMDRPSLECLPLPYTIRHFLITYEAPKGAAGTWPGDLVSNPFDLGKPTSQPRLEAYVYRSYPREKFNRRIMPFQVRDELKTDAGLRVLAWKELTAMRSILPPAWFEKAARLVADDPQPLVRMEAAPYPAVWRHLLIDPNRDVSRAALAEAAGGREFRGQQQPGLTPILMGFLNRGADDERCWALEAINRHGFGPQVLTRQYQEAIRAAARDPNPRVRETAAAHFGWMLTDGS